MAEHHASVTIHAPVHQVYSLFTHFNDFPKFMHFVKEVTYYDDKRSHWVVQVLRRYEWDAINEDWIEDRQIGWRSIHGLQNTGKVKFRPINPELTIVDVYIHYKPPTGPLGNIGENLGVNSYFDSVLQRDLNHFARMVDLTPSGALDPMSSHYLFHSESAITQGLVTEQQKLSMTHDPFMSQEALQERQARIEYEAAMKREAEMQLEAEREQKARVEREALLEQQAKLEREAARERERQERIEREAALARDALQNPDVVPLTLAGRYASFWRLPQGDRDSRRNRDPLHLQDPMTTRYPVKDSETT